MDNLGLIVVLIIVALYVYDVTKKNTKLEKQIERMGKKIIEQSENNQMANEKNFFLSKYLSGVNPEITNKYCAYIFKN